MNQPIGFLLYSTLKPKYYYGKQHDYVYYPESWTDRESGTTYEKGYYDENGQYYSDVSFTKNGQYDHIELQCGGQRNCPLDYTNLKLIGLYNFDDNQSLPMVVITIVNENDWPTGYGMKYVWKGSFFEYVGKCDYDANGAE